MRSLLEAYYEPQFSPASHGFRPDRGCHTALTTIQRTWKSTTWFIEGDISKCFDSLDHAILLEILRRRIRDNRFLRLIENLLRAGYLDGWRYSETYSGSPQGGIASPILANIYLDQLDKYVEMILLPGYNRGIRRKMSQEYTRLGHRMGRLRDRGFAEEAAQIRKEMRSIPSVQLIDQDYRRLRYVRYADDFLLGFTGPRDEAETIKGEIGRFLREELKLELSEGKTLITHARKEHARFLGHDITILGDSAKHRKGSGELDSIGRRKGGGRITGTVALEVPAEVVRERCKSRTVRGKPAARVELVNESEYAIVLRYEAEFRGLANYYQLAHNRSTRLGRLEWIMRTSLLKTLARKLRVSVREVAERFRITVQTKDGPRTGFQVKVEREGKKPLIASWGLVSLARTRIKDFGEANREDRMFRWNVATVEVVERLLADTCELCGSRDRIHVHHVRHLEDIWRKRRGQNPPPYWKVIMSSRKRKTLVVCHKCHVGIHHGRLTGQTETQATGEPDDAKVSRPVRRGADGKGSCK